MALKLLTDKYAGELDGMLSCYDRIVIQGSVQPFCYAQGMTHYLYAHDVRIFDYPRWAQPLGEQIRVRAEAVAAEAGLTIQFIRKKTFRKEDHVRTLLKKRGTHPGLVHIFSAMEPCGSYQPWHDKATGKTFLKPTSSKCLHYYFYFVDAELGLCYLRVPTWCPFRLQFYCNGHAWLATQLTRKAIAYTLHDNAFTHIADYAAAQKLADSWSPEKLQHKLDGFARQYCPVLKTLQVACHWSLWQTEYATDLVFKTPAALQTFYPRLLETLIHTVKPEDVAMFLGQKLHGNYQGEVGSHCGRRWHGFRLKHFMGPVSLKLYDKFRHILRIETTVIDVAFFRQYRTVRHRDGTTEKKWAPMKKSIYSLAPLRETLRAANHRYLEFLSAIETPEVGEQRLAQITETKAEQQHRYKGFNPLADHDAQLFRLLLRGEFAISGLTSRALHALLPDKTTGQLSRLLKRLRVHGLLKKVGHHYKYHLTDLGRHIATTVLKLREMWIIPTLAQPAA